MRLPEPRPESTWTLLRAHDVEELWDHARAPHVASSYQARMELLCGIVQGLAGANGRVLDVGCAQGTLGLMLAERGLSVTLLDIREQNIEYARARHQKGDVRFEVGFLGPTSPPSNDYDVVICTEVLEHVPRPAEFLMQLREKGRPGGALCLTTPNASYLLARHPSYGDAAQAVIDESEPNSLDGDSHRYLFTKEELMALARGIGLRVERHGFFLPAWLEGHLKTRYLHRLLYAARGEVVRLSPELPERLGRYLCSSQFLVARRPIDPACPPATRRTSSAGD
jgi:2-polyprenyl-3-methyl-5-hydroxy-6-metoxy-1,4-benzoquinol methylase